MKSTFRILLAVSLAAATSISTSGLAHATGFIVGSGNIEETTNIGTSWSFSGSAGGELDGLQFLDANTGVAVGSLGRVLRTTDGGTSWATITTPTTNQLEDVNFPSATVGYAVGAGALLKSTDAGATWSALTSPTGACWGLGVWFTSTTTGVIISDCGAIYRTTDGGATWASEISNTASRLEDIYFPTATTGYIVGYSHTILKTIDGGVTWTAQTSPVTNTDLKGVYFSSSTTGWAVGTNGTILFTTNGGTTWTSRGNPAGNRELRCIAFANDQEGVIGGAGVDLRTLDGGLSWIEIAPPSDNYNDIAMLPSTPLTGTVNVTVTSAPVGRHLKVDGGDWSASTTFRWLAGEIHNITADATQTVSGTEQYVFDHWSDSGALSHNVSRTSDGTFTVTYRHQFKLTTAVTSGSGSVSPTSAFEDAGSAVTITATPSAGYTFGSWAGSGSGSFSGVTNPASVTMNAAITENATFNAGPVTINLHSVPSGRTVIVDGVTRTTPTTVTWTVGTSHTLNSASPQAGATGTQYVWTSWSDAGARSHSVTASVSTTTYTANFKTQYLLTMTAPPSPWVATPASGYQDAGTTLAIDCTKNPLQFSSQYFFNWTGTGSGSYSGVFQQANITMNAPITETAGFESLPSAIYWVGTNPAGMAFSVNGTTYTDTTAFRFIIGTTYPVDTDSLQNANGTTRQRLLGWSDGGLASHNASAGLSADTLIASFRTQYKLTMVGDTGVVVGPISDYHDRGSALIISATPQPFFAWQGWLGTGSGSYTGGNEAVIITMNGAITQTARVQGVPIPTTIMPSSPLGQFTVDGVAHTDTTTLVFNAGSPHTIAAVTPITVATGNRLVFAGWSDLGATSHVIAPMAPDTLKESYKTNYLLTMDFTAGGTVSPSSGWFTPGAVSIQATPDSGKVFVRWTGTGTSGFTGTTNPTNINLQGPTTETADFASESGVGVGDDGPLGLALEQNAPNPVRAGGTGIAFSLPEAGAVRLEVLDLAGRRVATLASGAFAAGRHARVWDATSDTHQPLGAGLYFYRLTWGGRTLTRRLIVTR